MLSRFPFFTFSPNAMTSLFEPAVQQLLHELSPSSDAEPGVVFARVTRVVAKPEHTDDGGRTYSHFFGFARVCGHHQQQPQTVWFQKKAGISPLFLGPVRHASDTSVPPAVGSTLMGRIITGRKGLFLAWWASNAEPLQAFRELLAHGTRQKRNSSRLYRTLAARGDIANIEARDELYVLARVLVFADVGVLVDQLRDETQREKHADGAKTEAGFTTQRGYSLRFDPTEFAFLAAHVCASPVVFEHYARALRAAAEEEEKEGGSDGPLANAAADVERFDAGLIPAS